MEVPGNYRLHIFHLFNQEVRIGGMEGPHNSQNPHEVFKYLKSSGRDVLIGLHESEDFTKLAKRYGLTYFFIPIDDFSNKVVPAEVYDRIFEIIMKASAHNKQVNIHCGSGDGRTGTALAAIKLREIIENAVFNNPAALYQESKEPVFVKVLMQAKPIPCTPFVKAAIEALRGEVIPITGNGFTSVETRMDVKILMNYENHIKEMLKKALRKHKNAGEDEEEPPKGVGFRNN